MSTEPAVHAINATPACTIIPVNEVMCVDGNNRKRPVLTGLIYFGIQVKGLRQRGRFRVSPEHIMKSVPENENRIILAGDLGMEYYTVDQIFRGFVAPLIIWFLVTIMAVSLFQ